jgi:hypothetical protein
MTVVSMSDKEFSRLDILPGVKAVRITIRDACGFMGVRRRQVFECWRPSGRPESPA